MNVDNKWVISIAPYMTFKDQFTRNYFTLGMNNMVYVIEESQGPLLGIS